MTTEPKTISHSGARMIIAAKLLAPGELIGCNEHGCAYYVGHDGVTLVARPAGVRSADVRLVKLRA
jgi:hypothetical protein